MLKRTSLHSEHVRLGARLVAFAGWDMPIQYRSQLDEHHAVRAAAGMFDVAHMGVVDLHGPSVRDFLRLLLANDIARLTASGRALYSCMLRPEGGVIDDLIVTCMDDRWFRLVVNAGTTDKDLVWLRSQAGSFGVDVRHREDLGILAVQGPDARDRVHPLLPRELADRAADLVPFSACWHGDLFVGRTGYTGEDGYELILPHDELRTVWAGLLATDVMPCGLGARDTLRLEAGLNLYGQDMDETVNPLECGLGWTVSFADAQRRFIGREALESQRAAPPRRMIGLMLEGRGVLRGHMPVRGVCGGGEITSGGYAPTMKGSIALARVAAQASGPWQVEMRGDWHAVREVKPPFVRHGKVLVPAV